MPGWKYLKTCNHFDIYENEYYIPMGFVCDDYSTEEEFERVNADDRTQMILNTLVLSSGRTPYAVKSGREATSRVIPMPL